MAKRDQIRKLQEEIVELHTRNTLLKSALEVTQWGFNHTRCPVCAGWNMGPNGETDYKHTPDCIVAKALSAA